MRESFFRVSPIALLIAGLACGCKVGPEYCRPMPQFLEPQWSQTAESPRLNGQPANLSVWWQSFNDPQLTSLVEMAIDDNLQLKEAGRRILEARALRNVAAGSLYPQQQALNGSYSNVRISKNTANFVTVPGFFETDRVFDIWNSNFGLAWELDFWGRLRRTVESADAQVEQSMAAYDLIRIVMLAELAKTYIEMRTIEARIELVQKNIDIQHKLVSLADKRLNEGVGTKLDCHQASSNLAKVEALLPGLEILRRQSSHRICVLLGCAPTDIQNCLGEIGQIPVPPPAIAGGIPCDLLRRRPDVQVAERELAAQSAKIGIAEAEFYPHIALTGSIGLQAQDLSKLFQTTSLIGNVGPGFQWNLLNYGRIKHRVIAEQQAFERLCFAYQNSVLKAYQEVEDAQAAYINGFERLQATQQFVNDAESAAKISVAAYADGAIDFGRVLILQADVVRAQDELAAVRGDLALSLVKIYLAMGGGWSVSGCPTIAREATDAAWGSAACTSTTNLPPNQPLIPQQQATWRPEATTTYATSPPHFNLPQTPVAKSVPINSFQYPTVVTQVSGAPDVPIQLAPTLNSTMGSPAANNNPTWQMGTNPGAQALPDTASTNQLQTTSSLNPNLQRRIASGDFLLPAPYSPKR